MAKQLVVCVLVIFSLALSCVATTYTVGGTSGWDISTDLDVWVLNKTFKVGDVLVFQYSSSYSVCEMTQASFNACNTTNCIKSYTDGNTSIPLSTPGEKYFTCGNKLYCMGGMKLQVNAENDQATSPAGATQPAGAQGPLPTPSSKSNSPPIPTSSGFINGGSDCFVLAFAGFLATMLLLVT